MKIFSLAVLVFAVFQSSISNAAISEKLLNDAGLKTIWQSSIALNPPTKTSEKEKVQKITILGNYLYILTSGNYLYALERDTGQLSFGTIAAAPRLPVFEPAECLLLARSCRLRAGARFDEGVGGKRSQGGPGGREGRTLTTKSGRWDNAPRWS